MKMVFFLIPLFGAGTLFGQNLALNNENYNPPDQQVINPPVFNADQVMIQQKVVPVRMQQRAVDGASNNVNFINAGRSNNPPAVQQRGQTNSGYSGKAKNKKAAVKKSGSYKMKKVFSIFSERYQAPKHYGNKGRIRKCHGF